MWSHCGVTSRLTRCCRQEAGLAGGRAQGRADGGAVRLLRRQQRGRVGAGVVGRSAVITINELFFHGRVVRLSYMAHDPNGFRYQIIVASPLSVLKGPPKTRKFIERIAEICTRKIYTPNNNKFILINLTPSIPPLTPQHVPWRRACRVARAAAGS